MMRIISSLSLVLLLSLVICGQTAKNGKSDDSVKSIKSSPAYAEVLYRQVLVRSELEDLLVSYTDEYPKVRELRVEDDYLKQAMKRLLRVKSVNASILSSAVGKLIVEKVSLEMELWNLLQNHTEENIDVKKSKRKIKIFEDAINEIL